MERLWFWLIAAMIAIYLVLDGFDFGAGAIYLIAAKTKEERRRAMRAIGPVWDGDEVWLIAAVYGLWFAFPRVYAAVASGFCLPLLIALGLLILHSFAVGVRPHVDSPSGGEFFDVVLTVCSIVLILFIGVGLGNFIRGVPLDASGRFSLPFWTDFKLSSQVGMLDWYTVLIAGLALVTFTAHGSYYMALKTDEDLGRRARGFALICWPLQFFLTFTTLVATYFIRPEIMDNYGRHKAGILVPVVVVASLAVMLWANPKGKEKLAFLASCLYIVGMLVGTAFALYPVLLPARDDQYSLTIHNAAAGIHGLNVGLVWWTFAALLALAYFTFVYRKFSGKVQGGEGHY